MNWHIVRLAIPYLIIWLPVMVFSWTTLNQGACLEACALYEGVVVYAAVAAAFALSAIVALAQIAVGRKWNGAVQH